MSVLTQIAVTLALLASASSALAAGAITLEAAFWLLVAIILANGGR